MKKYKAFLAVINPITDEIESKRKVGGYSSYQEAADAAWAEKKDGESVVIQVPGELEDHEEEEEDTLNEIVKREHGLDENNR